MRPNNDPWQEIKKTQTNWELNNTAKEMRTAFSILYSSRASHNTTRSCLLLFSPFSLLPRHPDNDNHSSRVVVGIELTGTMCKIYIDEHMHLCSSGNQQHCHGDADSPYTTPTSRHKSNKFQFVTNNGETMHSNTMRKKVQTVAKERMLKLEFLTTTPKDSWLTRSWSWVIYFQNINSN